MRQITAKDLTGCMVALVTPMAADGQINLTQWRQLIQWHIKCGTRAVVVAGTTGESALLNDTETAQLISSAVDLCQTSETLVIVGTGAIQANQVIQANQQAKQLGADAVLVVTPYYLTLTQAALVTHYKSIAEVAELPIILYNVPGRTGIDLQPSATAELAHLPQIIGIKEAKADMQRIKALLKINDFAVLSGDDATFVAAMGLGANGVISVAANAWPQAIIALCNHAQLGNMTEAQTLNQKMQPMYDFLFHQPNPCPVKAIMHAAGMIDEGIRPPLQPTELKTSDKNRFIKSIRQETTLL